MLCDKLVCSLCGGNNVQKALTIAPTNGHTSTTIQDGFVCECGHVHEKAPICGGEVKNVWKKGFKGEDRLVDCVCNKCGVSYGRGALARFVFMEKHFVRP